MTEEQMAAIVAEYRFDNRFVNELPGDPNPSKQPRQVYNAAYSFVLPTQVAKPKTIAYSAEVASQLGFDETFANSERFASIFAGNEQLPGMKPFAMCYGGHQFGNWAGQLGDGRAINLGELVTPAGSRQTLQLKGAGLTPYSRQGDGLAVLRSSIREFLCSEAMHHLGVPTTRALSLVTTGETVIRDMFYNGNPRPEPGAIVCRVAPTFIRFGSFQIFASRQEIDNLRQLVDYTIRSDFPHLGEPSVDTYERWFNEVCERTASMIVEWLRVGFVHGVMNTDNMSILGLTIDYGPYGWLDDYDPNWTPNTTDAQNRRYRFGYQPQVAQWNLAQLANTLVPLFPDVAPLQQAIDNFGVRFQTGYRDMMAAKLGLTVKNEAEDQALIDTLQEVLMVAETDMTIFFRRLADVATEARHLDDATLLETLSDAYYQWEQVNDETRGKVTGWLRSYLKRAETEGIDNATRRQWMNRVNPKYVLRNYMAQLAIDEAEQGDNGLVLELLDLLRHPYDEQPDRERWFAKRPDWARSRPGCSMLSCSS